MPGTYASEWIIFAVGNFSIFFQAIGSTSPIEWAMQISMSMGSFKWADDRPTSARAYRPSNGVAYQLSPWKAGGSTVSAYQANYEQSMAGGITTPIGDVGTVATTCLVRPQCVKAMFQQANSAYGYLYETSRSSQISTITSTNGYSRGTYGVSLFSRTPPSTHDRQPGEAHPRQRGYFPGWDYVVHFVLLSFIVGSRTLW